MKEMPYAVIKSGGKQFVVKDGQTIRVPSVNAEVGSSIEISALLTSSDSTKVGSPTVDGAKVAATVVDHGRGQKMIVFKKKRRKHYKRTHGHRQGYTTIRIDSIG
ncbi:MAG TPA: 50S ribosomal protein L21 [Pyrinomonadaceae bacterium]|nr:50S ribosomal protein L21 [Pyrinomonadaceae bacterium]